MNRTFLPVGPKQKLPKRGSIAFRKNNLLCIGWHDKKHVILLSTAGSSTMATYIYIYIQANEIEKTPYQN